MRPLRLVGVTEDIEITAQRRSDKASPWLNRSVIRASAPCTWMPLQSMLELRHVHGRRICDCTPGYVSLAVGPYGQGRFSTFDVIDCPTCEGGKARRMTTCPTCKDVTRVYHL